MRAIVTMSLILLGSLRAFAHPPPQLVAPEPHRPLIEWSTWFRVSYEASQLPPATTARAIDPPAPVNRVGDGWFASLGADATFPASSSGDIRFGPWIETRGLDRIVAGGELQIGGAPHGLDMFWYRGEGQVTLRAGANRDVVTGAISWGYRAPWALWGPWDGSTRYMIGARFVLTATRAIEDRNNWSIGLGLEVEPVGALRYLLGIRSLY